MENLERETNSSTPTATSQYARKQYPVLLAISSVILWGFLALLTTKLKSIPPFLLLGLTLTLAGLFSLPLVKSWKVPWITMVVGVTGLFGNLFFYYLAFKLAPPIEVNLINYLWPTLIVLLSPIFLKGYQLKIWHLVAVLFGLMGTFLIITGGHASFSSSYTFGYISAFLGGLFWAIYSLLIKRLPGYKAGAIGAFSLIAGILALLVYGFQLSQGMEAAVVLPQDWIYISLMALGPNAIGNLTWNMAMHRGDPRVNGALSYLTPLFSTANLVLFGKQQISLTAGIACVLIVFGAFIGGMGSQLLNIRRIKRS